MCSPVCTFRDDNWVFILRATEVDGNFLHTIETDYRPDWNSSMRYLLVAYRCLFRSPYLFEIETLRSLKCVYFYFMYVNIVCMYV